MIVMIFYVDIDECGTNAFWISRMTSGILPQRKIILITIMGRPGSATETLHAEKVRINREGWLVVSLKC